MICAYIPEDAYEITLTKEEAEYLDTLLSKVDVGPLKRIWHKIHSSLENAKYLEKEQTS